MITGWLVRACRDKELRWHGPEGSGPDWSDSARLLAFSLRQAAAQSAAVCPADVDRASARPCSAFHCMQSGRLLLPQR